MASKRTDIEKLKKTLAKYDRSTVIASLRELDFPIAMVVGFRVKTFKDIQFEDGDWQQSEPKDDCITYTAGQVFPGEVEITHPDGTKQKHEYQPGKKVYVYGSVVHLPPE